MAFQHTSQGGLIGLDEQLVKITRYQNTSLASKLTKLHLRLLRIMTPILQTPRRLAIRILLRLLLLS